MSQYCYYHDPSLEETRQRNNRKGGRRGGRGRVSSELIRLQARFEELAQQVLDGNLDKSTAYVVGQLLNYARMCVRDRVPALEQEEVLGRIEELEEIAARQNEYRRQAW